MLTSKLGTCRRYFENEVDCKGKAEKAELHCVNEKYHVACHNKQLRCRLASRRERDIGRSEERSE